MMKSSVSKTIWSELKLKNVILLVIIIILTTVGFWSYNLLNKNNREEAGMSKIVKMKVGYIPVAQSLGFYIAQDKGYFKEVGLEVESVKFEAPSLFAEALISGQINGTANSLATGIMSIIETKNPDKFKIVGMNYTDENNPADVVVIRPDIEAQNFSELKGKTCATLAGPQFKVITNKLTEDASLKVTTADKEGDITFKELPVSELVTALGSKSVDCIIGLEPAGTIAISKGLGKLLGRSPISKAMGGRFYGGISAVNTDFAVKNPETVNLFIKAMDKATNYIQTNPIESKEYLQNYLNIDDKIAKNMSIPHFVSSKDMSQSDLEYINIFLSNFENQGVIEKKPDLKKLFLK